MPSLLQSICLSILGCVLALGILPLAFAAPAEVQVDFLAVGQGDAILIQSPTGRRVLMDTGPAGDVLMAELARVLPPMARDIDLVMLTHSDRDHIGGMEALLQRYRVGEIVHNDEGEPKEGMDVIIQDAHARGIPLRRAHPEQDLRMETGVLLDFLSPLEGSADSSANNHSLVAMLVLPKSRILLTGDAETPVEHELLRQGKALRANVLKGGHHGSKTSSSEEFLAAVGAGLVLFQNGLDNSYGHPAKEVMERLAARAITVYNTGIDGAITLRCAADSPCRLTSPRRDHPP